MRFALLMSPVDAAETRADYAGTFTEIDPSAPALVLGELSAQRGDGVFESIGVVDGHAQEVGPHLERLARSAVICDLPAPNIAQWRQAIARAAAHCGAGEAVIKLLLSRGVDGGVSPTAWVTAAASADFAAARTEGVRVVTLDRGYDSGTPTRAPWLLQAAKTLSYAVNMAALREAKRRGADDVIFVTSDGIVLEAPTASVILRIGDRFVTPTPTGGILHGTTQVSLFAHLTASGHDTAYDDVPVQALAQADAAWLVSSVRLAAPVTEIDGTEIPMDAELTASLNQYLLSPRD
jgi:4-amino-4-deoxychorismate lyase